MTFAEQSLKEVFSLKKVFGVGMAFAIIFFLVYFFIFSNRFSDIIKVEYQKYNQSEEKYGEVIVMDDEKIIKQLTKILDKANHQKTEYKKGYHDSYKLTLYYEDETSEIIRVWKDFGQDYDLLESDTKDGVYKLKHKQSRETLNKFLY